MIINFLQRGALVILAMFSLTGCNFSNRPEEFARYDSAKYERVSINYERHGRQDTTLVFIHDWNLNLSYWNMQVNSFKSRYKVINLDLAGHGDSGKARTHWTAESFARDITNILEKESVSNAILIGHSLGTDVALEVYKSVPDKVIGIIGIESFRDVDFFLTEDFVDSLHDGLSHFKRNYSEMVDEMARKNIRSRNREVIKRIVADYKKADPKIALAIYKNTFPNHEKEKEHLRKLPFKIQVIVSDYAPVDEMALAEFAHTGYELVWIQDAGHFPMIEQPDQFQDVLEKIIKKITLKDSVLTGDTIHAMVDKLH